MSTTMDEPSAQNIVRTSIRVMALLDQLAGDLQTTLPYDTFNEVRLLIGGIMGSVTFDLISPSVALHPSLNVESPEAWREVGELDASHWLRSGTTPEPE